MVCKGRICLFANSCKWLCKAIYGVYLSIHCAIECSVLQRLCKSYAGTFQTLPKNAEKRPVWAAFLILIQHAKRFGFPRFPAGQHPKNGFISPFAGKNSFLKPHALQILILCDPSQRSTPTHKCWRILRNARKYIPAWLLCWSHGSRNSPHAPRKIPMRNSLCTAVMLPKSAHWHA